MMTVAIEVTSAPDERSSRLGWSWNAGGYGYTVSSRQAGAAPAERQ
jgi:hypothetical protein